MLKAKLRRRANTPGLVRMRAILAHGDIAAVVRGGLDGPVGADGLGGAGGGDRRVRDVEGGLGRVSQQPGPGVAGEDVALDADDGGDMVLPAGVGQAACGMEHGDGAAFVAVASAIAAAGRPERRRGRADLLDLLVQGRLVVLDLHDQSDVGCCGDLEMFFWQCSASRVTIAPWGTPSSASSACAAGISLDLPSTST